MACVVVDNGLHVRKAVLLDLKFDVKGRFAACALALNLVIDLVRVSEAPEEVTLGGVQRVTLRRHAYGERDLAAPQYRWL